MKKINLLIVLVFVLSFFATSYGSVKTEIIRKEIKEENKNQRSEVRVQYPQIKYSNLKMAKRFNEKVEVLIKDKIKGYKKNVVGLESDSKKDGARSVGYDLTIDFQVEMIGDNFVSISFGESTYLGGAHPSFRSYSINYDLKNGREFKLRDMFKRNVNYLKTISAFSIMKLSKKQGERTEWIEKGAAATESNYDSWTISQYGLKFVFDPYQVGAYALGSFEVMMPYESLPIDIRSNWMKEIVNDISNVSDSSKQLVYDGESYKNTGIKITKKDHAFAKNEFEQNTELIYKSGRLTCADNAKLEVEVKSIAYGSFTKPNSTQTAYLYEYCRNYKVVGIGGILITEGDKTIVHYAYGDEGLFSTAYALPDINKNGLTELVLVSSNRELGFRTGAVELVEVTNDKVKFMGRTQVFFNDYVAVEDKAKAKSISYKVFVEPNSNPTFYRETYTSKDNGNSYNLIGKSKRVKFNLDEPIFFTNITKMV